MEVENQYLKKSEIGYTPIDWEIMPIMSAFEICNNLRLPISETIRKKNQGEYPYFGPTKIQDYINEYRIEGEYALIGEDGDHFFKWNEMPMTQLTKGKFNVNNHAHIIKGKKGTSITSWFYYYFKHRNITHFLSRQGAGRFKLSKGTLSNIPCAIPKSILEQEKITNVLSTLDAYSIILEEKIEKKVLLKKGLVQKLLTADRDWEEKELVRLIDYIPSGNYGFEKPLGDMIPFPVVTTTHIDDSDIWNNKPKHIRYFNRGIIEKYLPQTGDMIVVKASGSAQSIQSGKIGYITYDIEGSFVFSNFLMLLKPKGINSKYLYYYLTSYHIKRLMPTLVEASTYPNIKLDEYFKVIIKYPSLKKQTNIANTLSIADEEIAFLKKKLLKTKQLNAAIMKQLLSGKIRLVQS